MTYLYWTSDKRFLTKWTICVTTGFLQSNSAEWAVTDYLEFVLVYVSSSWSSDSLSSYLWECQVTSYTNLIWACCELSTGGMDQEGTMFYKRLADQVAKMTNTIYSKMLAWIRCNLSVSMLRSAVMCIRARQPINTPPCTHRQHWAWCCGEPAHRLTHS